jgi:hypothetical protein
MFPNSRPTGHFFHYYSPGNKRVSRLVPHPAITDDAKRRYLLGTYLPIPKLRWARGLLESYPFE